jgi:hypothetical protein
MEQSYWIIFLLDLVCDRIRYTIGFRSEVNYLGFRVSDPDLIRSVDPGPYSESGSGSRRAKMTHKSRKN